MRRKEDSEREREREGERRVVGFDFPFPWEEGGMVGVGGRGIPRIFWCCGCVFCATLSLSSSGGEYKFLSLTRL